MYGSQFIKRERLAAQPDFFYKFIESMPFNVWFPIEDVPIDKLYLQVLIQEHLHMNLNTIQTNELKTKFFKTSYL